MRQQLIDDSTIKYRDLLEIIVIASCLPRINRKYRVIVIFLTISPARHSNRRYSSIIKNRDLLHNYLVVPITTPTYVRRKSIREKKRIENTARRKGVLYFDSISPCLCQAEAGAHCYSYPLWAIYMAVNMPGHGDLAALLVIPNGFMVTLWAPTA